MKCVSCICVVVLVSVLAVRADNSNHVLVNATDEYETPTEIFEQIMMEQCSRRYSLVCLKLDAIKMVDRLGQSPGYQLLPGVSLVHVDDGDHRLPHEVIASLVEGNVTSLDTFLARRIKSYVDSLTLSVRVVDTNTVISAKKIGENLLYGSPTEVEEGRRKKGGHHGGGGGGGGHGGHGAAMWMCSTIAAIGMAGLAAVSGKALMTALLALVLAAAGAMKGGGGGGHKCGHYDSTGRQADLPLDRIASSANTLIQLPQLKTAFDPASNSHYH